MILEHKLKNYIQNWKKFLAESASGDSAHAVLVKDGKILIVRRSTDDAWMPNHYGFPGGKIEAGESIVDALSRECKEETNLIIKPENFKFLAKVSNKLGHKFYLVTQFEGDVSLNDEHDDFKWINPKELSNFITVPDLVTVIEATMELL